MIKYKIKEDDFNLLASILDKRSQVGLLPKVISREILMSENDINVMMDILFDEFVDKGTKSSEYEPNEYGERVEDLMDKINATRLNPLRVIKKMEVMESLNKNHN